MACDKFSSSGTITAFDPLSGTVTIQLANTSSSIGQFHCSLESLAEELISTIRNGERGVKVCFNAGDDHEALRVIVEY